MKHFRPLSIFLLGIYFITISYRASADISVIVTSNTLHGFNISCFGGQDGSIHVEVTGGNPPYEIYMNGDLVSANITQLPAGTYSFIVYDTPLPNHPAELPGEGWITLTEPTPLQLNTTPHVYGNNFNVSCYYCHDGYVTLNGQGGVSPYNYLWFDYSTNQTHYSLGTGSYSALMTDANGCEAHVDNFFLSAPSRDDWTLLGNSGIDSTKFMGTTDNKDFIFKTNNTERLRIKRSGKMVVSSLEGTGGMVSVNTDGELVNAVTYNQPPDDHDCSLGPHVASFQGYISPHVTLFTCPYINVGIGTYEPAQFFTVAGNSRLISNSPPNSFEILGNGAIPANRGISLDGNPSGKFNFYINGTQTNASFNFINKQNSSNLMTISANGEVGIGIDPSSQTYSSTHYKLLVGGKIGVNEAWVSLGSPWPDYVFCDEYKLKSLQEIEKFVRLNKHLPDMPSQEEITGKDRINLGEIQTKTVKEIEELYLHLIKMDQRIQELELKNSELAKVISSFKK